jgi:RHS repeat-associated protein
MSHESQAGRVVALVLFALVSIIMLASGVLIAGAIAQVFTAEATAVSADTASDTVAATAAEFRVDESGAATYSIALYGVPGTAGVSPKLSLNYSSQGGYGPIGKGWSISGLSSISRCRATREAGDFIVGGVATDGSPQPVNYSGSDRYCLDGQRLIPAPSGSAACPAVSGMVASNLRTEIESFQRVCAYTPTGGTAGVAFFTVERKDGSTSWYGDRVISGTQNLGYNGYVNSTVPGKEAFALSWAQTRLQDSTGNYIDFVYYENLDSVVGEHLIKEVRYTGKVALSGQTIALNPYARIVFNYSLRAAVDQGKGYQGGGQLTQAHRLDSITSCNSLTVCDTANQARYYQLTYAPTPSLSNSNQPLPEADVLTNLRECRDSSKAVCMPATTFTWSTAKYEFATKEYPPNLPTGSLAKFEGFKLGDIDGDGRQDIVYLKDDVCSTEGLFILYGITDASGNPSFTQSASICTPSELHWYGEGSWHLFDYNGDGRDDLFVRGASSWAVYASQGRAGNMNFNTAQNLIASLSPAIPSQNNENDQVQLADLNGDGLTDIVYPSSMGLKARLMERGANGFGWGAERSVVFDEATLGAWQPSQCSDIGYDCYVTMGGAPTPKTGFTQLADFNGDASSDVLLQVNQHVEYTGFCEPPPCPNCQPEVVDPEPLSVTGETLETDSVLADAAYLTREKQRSYDVAATSCPGSSVTRKLHAATIRSISATTVVIGSYASIGANPYAISLADANGDGLTDWFYRSTSSAEWYYRINTGSGMQAAVEISLLDFEDQTRFVDVNGDGRADVLHPFNAGGYKAYNVKYAQASGGYGAETWLPGVSGTNANALLCEGYACDHTRKVPMFSDFDGDGSLDFLAIKMDDNADVFLSRANNRFAPRDVITRITNGFGAQTDIVYAPLTNAALYRRDSGTRNATNWGRGAPVIDLLAPMYVVARASSSSPLAGNASANATLHYRYAGARMQAGGRGFLGFDEIVTIDPNESGGYVTTTTTYAQNFPFIGMPLSTIKRAAVGQTYAIPACLNGALNDTCYATPGALFPTPAGNWFSDSSQVWEADTDFAGTAFTAYSSGAQLPVQVRTAGTDEKVRDPISGAQTSRIVTTFDYGAYGNVSATTADTYTGTASTATATLITSNSYADNVAMWRLGRLAATTVTHRRPSRADIVRVSDFGYNMSGPITGLLAVERVQPGGTAAQLLRKEYTLDEFGNRTAVETCANPATACDSSIVFHPATSTAIERYSRTVYSSDGRFPVATYEPFWNGTGAVERKTSEVISRNIFGDPTEVADINGVRTVTVAGALGRAYYNWAQTVAGAVSGDPAGGRESWTQYRWCGTGSGQVNCPSGAKFRQAVQGEGIPSEWTYFDVLGRPMMKATQTFNVGVSGKDVSAVCTDYTSTGKPRRVSNPFFVAGTSGVDGPTGLDSLCISASRLWTTTTYDVLGRPTDVTSPDQNEPGGLAIISTDYSGNTTTLTDARGTATTQVRNGKGELVSITDAAGLVTTFYYYADGSTYVVRRDAGRGLVDNVFYYDALGRKTQQNDPDAGVNTYEYNALGELIAQQDAAGNRIENEIDARGRVWRKTVRKADATVESQSTFTFDIASNGAGQPASEIITGTYGDWVGQTAMALGFSRSYSYDTLGRGAGSTTTIDGTSYAAAVQYDWLGRAWKALDASGHWAKTVFNARGMNVAVCSSSLNDTLTSCPADANTYLQTLETDPWGHVIKERRGNSTAMEVTRSYKPDTGRTWTICAGTTSCNLMNEGYGWDANGNLHTQQKEGRYLEQFTYDDLNRLKEARLAMQDGITVNQVTQSFEYDALGNLCHRYALGWATRDYTYIGRSGCGLGGAMNSTYGSGGTGAVGPHQVSALMAGLDPLSHYYDIRGNQTIRQGSAAGNGRTIRYSLDDKAYEATSDTGASVRFWYGSDGARYKRMDGSKKTLYLGSVEIVIDAGITTIKRTVAGVMLQTVVGATATNYYLFHDQLGSLVHIANASGALINNMDFLAFGGRRNSDNQQANGTAPTLTTRGFTGHEMVDSVGLVHMNGRIYDVYMGRFLQVDPVIQEPNNAQSWNAYTYVFNNPLTYTDPTGAIGMKERQWLAVIFAAVATYFCPFAAGTWQAFFYAVFVGAASGGIATGTWQGAAYGAFAAGLFYGIGTYFQNAQWAQASQTNNAFGSGLTWGGYGAKVLAHGAAGGVTARMQGGKFGAGFASAGVAEAFSPAVDSIGGGAPNYSGERVAAAAILGGTTSVIAGGKFANGAVTAAFSRAFNEEAHHVKFKAAIKAKVGSYLNAAIEQNAELKMNIADAEAVDIEMTSDGVGLVNVGGNKFKFSYHDPFGGLQGYVKEFSIRRATFGVGVTDRGYLSIQAGFSSNRYVPAALSKYVSAGITVSMEASPVDIVVNNSGLLGNAARALINYPQKLDACIRAQENGNACD